MLSPPSTPQQHYLDRLRKHEAEAARLTAAHRTLGYLRLLLAAVFLAAAWFSFEHRYALLWLLALLAALFVLVSIVLAKVLRQLAQARRGIAFYSHGIARIEDRWSGLRPREPRPELAASSLYAADLDILRPGGLFELLCAARTRMGEDTLLGWLLNPAAPAVIHERQAAVTELRSQLDLREGMAISGSSLAIGLHPEALQAWAEAPIALAPRWLRWPALLLGVLSLAALVFWLSGGSLVPFLTLLAVDWAIHRSFKRPVAAVFGDTEETLQDLELLSVLLRHLERAAFHSPRLLELQSTLSTHDLPGSEAIARLGSLVAWKQSLNNPIVRALDVPLLYSLQLAFAIQRWRSLHGRAIRAWLQAVGEAEALLSLAAFSFEHPADPFPTFVAGPASLQAEDLGHPLLPASRCIRNSLRLGGQTRVLLISGSNMSGKSTLMRALGVNTVLAMCGAPVRARSMQLTALRTAASLLVNDSLEAGHSRFYAEIERLQRICSLAAQPGPPVLFLLDELLQGTNSLDRLQGAEGILQALVEAGAVGLVATHDLALTAIGRGGGLGLENRHFEEQIVDGRMTFDFQLRPGVVTRSNGVELMRLLGLKV